MLVYYFVPFIVSNYLLFWVSNGHNSVTVQNRTHVYVNFFHHKDLGNHILQLCPKVVKHPVYTQKQTILKGTTMNNNKCKYIFHYQFSSETYGCTLIYMHILNKRDESYVGSHVIWEKQLKRHEKLTWGTTKIESNKNPTILILTAQYQQHLPSL